MIQQFLEALDEEKEYDFIANFYPHMSKFDLRTILLEYIYAAHSEGEEVEENIRDAVREELEDKECNL